MRRWWRVGWASAASAGCSEIEINYAAGTLTAGGKVIHRGEYLALDGTGGEVIEGRVPTVEPVMSPFFKKFLVWADAERRLGVRANADTPHDAKVAREFRCRRHRAVPHRTYVFRPGANRGGARDDPG